MKVRKQQLQLDMKQQTCYKLGKEYDKAVYCHPAYLSYMQSTLWEMLDWMKWQAGIKIAGRNISNLRYADDTTLTTESKEELKSLLMKVKERSEKTDWFKTGWRVHQGCILSTFLFNLYAEYIMWNTGLDESQAGIKIARTNINNLRYADDSSLMAESKKEYVDYGERRVKELA